MSTALALARTLRPWGIIFGATVGGLSLMSRADDLLIKHLDTTFATKADVAQIDKKVDTVLHKLDEAALRESLKGKHK